MPNIEKALRREKKIKNKRKHGRDGDSVKLILRIQQKRRDEILKKLRKQKEEIRNGTE
jgi:hypothetical protein